jgi:phenylalanine-4-hydroxylase
VALNSFHSAIRNPQSEIFPGAQVMNKTEEKKEWYTGDIGEVIRSREQEYTAVTQDIAFTSEQHAIWAELYDGVVQPHLLEHLCREFTAGLELLQLDPQRIPSIGHLNERIQPHTGWRIERTAVRYTKANDWYAKFAQRIFLITDYLRSHDQIKFTPEPDMFHDIFGHLPYLTLDFYARLEDKFAPAYLKATETEREVIKRLAWYSTEFGLVMEGDRIKIFGAGIISGRGELANTIMELYRLDRDDVVAYSAGNVYTQICAQFAQHKTDVDRIIAGINRLHQRGEMSSQDQGWNVVRALYDDLGIPREGYFGGEVLIAPFEIEYIARIPKTVYAFNPIFFVFESFAQLDALLDSYLEPIARR